MNVETIKQRVKPFEQFSTDSRDQWGDRIDLQKLAHARRTHNRDSQEYVFFLSDFTVWGSANNSVMATEKGISAKYSDELQPVSIAWQDIDIIESMPETAIRLWSGGKRYWFTMFQNGVKDEYLALFKELIHENISAYQTEASFLDDLIDKTSSNEEALADITSSIALCDQLLNMSLTYLETQYDKRDDCGIKCSDYLGVINKRSSLLTKLGKTNQAKTDLIGFIESCHRPNPNTYGHIEISHEPDFKPLCKVYFDACILLSALCEASKELDDATVFLNLAAKMTNPDYQRNAKDLLQKAADEKMAYMPVAPRESRQMILCVEDIPTWPVKEFCFADARMLRSFKWKFETGHPQAGEMYICHPLRPDHYYEVKSFHDRLFDEKRSELVYLLESIGARHVHVEAMTGTSIEDQKNEAVSGKVSDELFTGTSTEGSQETRDNSRRAKCQIAIEDRELNPAGHPHIPEDLIWYPHEPSWQRIAQSALAKRYMTLSVELRYHEDFSINQKRMTQVHGALKLFTKQIEIGWNEETEKSLRQRKATIWKYTAAFGNEPINRQESQAKSLSEAEVEYLDDLKAALSDGAVAESTRKILERHRVKLAISAERAVQLEQSIKQSHLSDNEKEYLQDLEDCYADGVISDPERRILARRLEKLGISEERSSELEQMITMKIQGGQ